MIEKVVKRKGNELYVKWKCYDNAVNSWTDKKRDYFDDKNKIEVELDFSNYATKSDLKNAIC